MKKLLLSFFTTTCITLTLFLSVTEAGVIDHCNELYHQKRYTPAIDCYQEVGHQGFSAPLFFNIANSYARLDQTGSAVLYYLRALCLAPSDADIRANLDLIRKEKGIFPPETTLVHRFVNLLTITQWSNLGLLALFSYLICSFVQLRKKLSPATEIAIGTVCGLLLVCSIFGSLKQYELWQQSVVINDSPLLVSPFDGAASIGSIKQGRLATPEKQHNNYVYIIDETGRKGWLPEETIKPIMLDNTKN